MKRIAFKINDETLESFRDWYLERMVDEEIEVVSFSKGLYYKEMPKEMDEAECEKEITALLEKWGFYYDIDFTFE